MFRFLVRLVLGVLPWVGRFVRMLFVLMITAITSIFVGIPRSVDRIGDSWTEQVAEGGIPVEHHQALRTGARIVAVITLILGWLVLASLTVFILRLLF